MRLDEITKKDEFKATLSDPNYLDVLDKFKELKSRVDKNNTKLSYSYNFFVKDFIITVTSTHSKNDKNVFKETSILITNIYLDYNIWSDAITDVDYGKFKSTIDYHIYTEK